MVVAAPAGGPVAAAARNLSRAILSAAATTQSWTSSHDNAVHCYLSLLPPSSSISLSPSLISSTIDPHLLPHHRLSLGLFHWSSLQPGFSHTSRTFHSLLLSLSRSPHHGTLRAVLNQASSLGVILSPLSSFLAAKSLLRCKQTREAFKVINGVRTRFGLSPDAATEEICNSLLAATAEDELWDRGKNLFDEMLERGVPLTDEGLGVFIHGICRRFGLEMAMEMARKASGGEKLTGSLMAALVVDGLCVGGRAEEGWQALEKLRKVKWKPDFVPYRIVSEEFKKLGRVESSVKILKQKRKFGVAPRVSDYGKFILRSILERRIVPARRLGEALAGGNFPVESTVVDALIGSIPAADFASAFEFCRFMVERRGECPSLHALRNLCSNLLENKKGEEMWEILRYLLSKGFMRDLEGYGMIVFFLCKVGMVREAYEVLKEMRKGGLRSDLWCYNCLMEACCREDLIRPAKKLWDEMFASGCGGDLQTFKTLICKLAEIGDDDGAIRLLRLMEEKNLTPDETISVAIARVLCRKKRIDEVKTLMDETLARGSHAIAGSIMTALALDLCQNSDFEAAIAIIRRFPATIGRNAHCILLKKLAEDPELHKLAVDHVEWIRDNGGDPGLKEVILRELVGSLSLSPNLESVMIFVQALRRKNLLPNDSLWTDLCR